MAGGTTSGAGDTTAGGDCVPVAAQSPELQQLVLVEVRIAAQPAVDDLNTRLAALGVPPWQPTDDEVGALVGIELILAGIAGLPAYDCAGRLDVIGIDEAEVRARIADDMAAAVAGLQP